MPSKLTVAFGSMLLCLAGLVVSCSGDKPAPEPVLRSVRAVQVFASGGERTRTFAGVARAGVESRLSFRVAGTVQRLLVEVGQQVKEGELIAELDPEDYNLQVQDARASLSQARAQLRNAQSAYDRARDLYENRNASKQDLDAARAQFESASAMVQSGEKRLELAQNQLGYTKLRAPRSGAIASCDVEVNENVSAGKPVCLLTSDGNIEVEVAIPEILISQIREGGKVSAQFDALPNTAIPGTVTEVGVAATDMATTYPVTVRLDNSADAVRSGMAAEVTFQFAATSNRETYLVPSVAVAEDRNGRFVFIVAAADTPGVGEVSRRPVTIGELTGDGLEVSEGLSDGDFVITAGVSKLTDGQRVRFDADGAR